ncbi:MAG: hypothetical protein KJP00_09600 [Bacteroidia bacterium]|nr:hypothetical protein [Bacteroidia bacterium]
MTIILAYGDYSQGLIFTVAVVSKINLVMKDAKELTWEYGIPFLKNTFILKSVGKVFGIAMLAMLIIVYIINLIEGNPRAFFMMLPWLLMVCLLVAIIAFLASWIVLGNRYHVRYTINEEGIWMMGTEGRFDGVARATAIIGFLKKNPTVAGAGLLAKNSDGYMIAWKDIGHIDHEPEKSKFQVRQSARIQMPIFCTNENYPQVNKLIDTYHPT